VENLFHTIYRGKREHDALQVTAHLATFAHFSGLSQFSDRSHDYMSVQDTRRVYLAGTKRRWCAARVRSRRRESGQRQLWESPST
jgi:hypothetical protein